MPKAAGARKSNAGAAAGAGIGQRQLNSVLKAAQKYRDKADALDERINKLESRILELQLKPARTDATSNAIRSLENAADSLRSRRSDYLGQASRMLSKPQDYMKR